MTTREYDRRFSSHIVSVLEVRSIAHLRFVQIDWILFTAMASPCIVFPFFLWFKSKSKYELLLAKDKAAKKAQ